MFRIGRARPLLLSLTLLACSSSQATPGPDGEAAGGSSGAAGTAVGGFGGGGAPAVGGNAGDAPMGGAAGGGAANVAGAGGLEPSSAGASGTAGSAGGASRVPADYEGTAFKTLVIPGTIAAADYDRGGPGVAYCHGNESSCDAGIVTGDWAPPSTPVYRTPVEQGAAICGGAACDDNVGLCHMNASKPDNTTSGELVMPQDVYVCYMATGEWLKYTVQVTEPGTYAVGGKVAGPALTVELDFGDGITTGVFAVPASPTESCACTESYHSWQTLNDLATVTFPTAGTYLMTFEVVTQQFNADTWVFTKM